MDLAGAKLLFAIILVILIVFAGAVPPAQRNILDTWYGRLGVAITILVIAKQAGWWFGILATVAVLVLMPMSMREGFSLPMEASNLSQSITGEGFRGGVLETGNQQMNSNFEDMEEEEKLSSIEEPFWGSADKKQPVPMERRRQWFIEEVMDEHPETIETDGVETQAPQ